MSEKNNINDFDLMMKSILDEAQEVVPERVWEGVSAGLDKAARRKTVALWWRRAAVGAAAAAAAVVVMGIFYASNIEDEIVPAAGDGDMIAVVEPVTGPVADDDADDVSLLAEVEDEAYVSPAAIDRKNMIPENAAEAIESSEREIIEHEQVITKNTDSSEEKAEEAVTDTKKESGIYFPEDWGEEKSEKKRDVSLVLSGVAGTNNALDQNKFVPMKRPDAAVAPKVTGIEETSVKSSYGIPLSFGAGVKFDLSPRWSIGTGVNYTYLTRQFYGKYTKVSPEGDIESVTSSDIRNQQHYMGIPVNAFCDIISNDKISFYAYAGGAVEKCVSDSYRLLNTDISHKEKIAGIQLSANAGVGVEFMLGKHLGLYIDPSVRYYFKNEKQPKSIRTVQPLMLGFEMGLRARL